MYKKRPPGSRWFPPGFDGSPRRGRCPHRPARFCVQGSPPNRTVSHPRRRGGLYGRPEPGYDSHRGSMVPFAVGVRSATVHPTRRCAGGYKIRPYGPAPGLLVGAGFMPARDRVPTRAGVRRFRPLAIRVQGTSMNRKTPPRSMHRSGVFVTPVFSDRSPWICSAPCNTA